MSFVTHAIESTTGKRFEELYRIYADALPKREQKKRVEIEALVARPDYRFLAIEENGTVISFAIVQISSSQPIALLEYMATDSSRRNTGVGAHVFGEVVNLVDTRTLIVEADSERETDADDLAIRVRRKNFYRRLGCRQLKDVHYILPLPGEGDPPLMDLLAFRKNMPRSVARDDVKQWLAAIYAEVYAQSAADPRLELILSNRHSNDIELI